MALARLASLSSAVEPGNDLQPLTLSPSRLAKNLKSVVETPKPRRDCVTHLGFSRLTHLSVTYLPTVFLPTSTPTQANDR
jgi:hypothetical protein